MSDLWFAGNADPWGAFGFSGPDPITVGSGWTWDVEFTTRSSQTTYARSSINSVALSDGGMLLSGIVQYRTRNSKGVDKVHPVGQSDGDGIVDFISATSVDSVTFGWSLEADTFWSGGVTFEVWVS